MFEILAIYVLVQNRNVSLTQQNKFDNKSLIILILGVVYFVYLPMVRTTDNSK